MRQVTLQCPVCRHKFQANEVSSSNNARGQDSDLFSRAAGFSPELYAPKVCPACAYAGYREDFSDTVHFAKSTKTMLRSRLWPGTSSADSMSPSIWPPWEKYEQVVRTYGLLGRPTQEMAYASLSASWCVRELSEWLPGIPDSVANMVYKFTDSMIERSDSLSSNRAEIEVQLAREIAKSDSGSSTHENRIALLAAIRLLRDHGENCLALSLLTAVKPLLSPQVFQAFSKSLEANIALERYYQRLALRYYDEAVTAKTAGAELPSYLYIEGELSRRLGEDENAIRFFNEALREEALQARASWVTAAAMQQLTLFKKSTSDSTK